MHVDLKIHYDSRSARFGNRRFSEAVSLELRDVSPEEAPEAVRMEYVETRWFEGRHFRRLGPMGGPQETVSAHAFLNKTGLVRPYVDLNEKAGDRKYSAARHPQVTEEYNRIAAHERLGRLVGDAISIGGEIWIACGEPRMHLSQKRPPAPSSMWTSLTEYTFDTDRIGSHVTVPHLEQVALVFPIGEDDLALATQAALGVSAPLPDYTVLRPESIGSYDYEACVRDAGLAFLRERHKNEAVARSVGIHPEMARLRALTDPDMSSDADDIVECLRSISSGLPRATNVAKHLSIIVDRWDSRPLSLELEAVATPAPKHR